jgi:hypothetical protein
VIDKTPCRTAHQEIISEDMLQQHRKVKQPEMEVAQEQQLTHPSFSVSSLDQFHACFS